MKRFLVMLLAFTLVFTIFATEFKTMDKMYTPDKPKMGGILYLAVSSSPQSFNFYGTLDGTAYAVVGNMLNALVEMDPVTNELQPGLAKSWEVSADNKVVTFHLRDVKWSDGKQFTADDVIFTFKYFLMNKFAEGNSIARFTIAGEPIKFEKVDDKTIKAYLPLPYGPFFTVLSHASIYPKHVLENKINYDDLGSVNKIWTTDTPLNEIVGTGPYALSQYIVDQKIVMKKNPYFWKKDVYGNTLPYVDALEYLIIRDTQVTSAKFIAGEIDYMSVSAADYPLLKQREIQGAPISIYKAEPKNPTPSPLHIAINLDAKNPELREAFNNKNFRAVLEFTLDRERVIDEVYNTLAVLGGVPVLPANTAFYNPAIEQLRRPFNPEKAKQMLNEMGYIDRNGDGWRDYPSGRTIEFVLVTNTNQIFGDTALIFSEDLKKIGLKCELQILDGSLHSQKALSGDYELCLWAFGNQPDPQLRKAIWSPGYSLYYNHLSTMDPETKEPYADLRNMYDWEKQVHYAFEIGQSAMDPRERKVQYGIWQEIYAEYVPFIFVCKGMDLMGSSKKLGNFYQLPNESLVYTSYTVYKK